MTLPTPWLQTSGLRNCENTNSCCFKPPNCGNLLSRKVVVGNCFVGLCVYDFSPAWQGVYFVILSCTLAVQLTHRKYPSFRGIISHNVLPAWARLTFTALYHVYCAGSGSRSPSQFLQEPSIGSPCCLIFYLLFNMNLISLFYFKLFVLSLSLYAAFGSQTCSINAQPQSQSSHLWNGSNNGTHLTRWICRSSENHCKALSTESPPRG